MPATSRLVRVFISSTFRDFMGERDELVKRTFPELRRRCRERFVEFVEIDLRWGITEEQAQRGEVLPICLAEIDRCRPSEAVFFLGLLGERYGWIPDSDQYDAALVKEQAWLKEHIGGKSVTELEVLHGVLNNPKIEQRAYFYFRHDGYEQRHWKEIEGAYGNMQPPLKPGDFTNETADDPAAADQQQRQLKQAILKSGLPHPPRDYETPHDMGPMILEDLWAGINRIFPASEIPDEIERETREHQVFQQSRSRAYVKRQGLFDALDTFVSGTEEQGLPDTDSPSPEEDDKPDPDHDDMAGDEDSAPRSRPLVVLGESGSGKSALLAAWLTRHQDQVVFYHFVGATPASDNATSILKRLFSILRRRGVVSPDREIPRESEAMAAELPEWLERLSDAGGGVILIDALNQLAASHDRELWWWPEDWPENVRVVVSSLPGESLKEMRRRGWTGGSADEDALSIPQLQPQEKEEIMRAYLGLFGKEKGLGAALEKKILAADQTANPLFLRTLVDELRVRAAHEDLEDRLEAMLGCPDPAALFVYVLRNLERDHTPLDKDYKDLIHWALGLMGCARRGLTENELLELLSPHEIPRKNPVPHAHWAPFYLALEESLVSRDGQLGFFHDYLRQAVMDEYLDEEFEQKAAHDYLAQPALDWDKERFSDSLVDYGFRHGIRHLVGNRRLDDALALIRSAPRREAAAENEGTPDNLHDELARLRKAWAIDRPEEHETGVELTALALTEPQRLAHHLRQQLEEAGKNGDWKRAAHLAEAGRSPAEQVMLALRSACHASSPPNEDLNIPLDRWLRDTGRAEWQELADQITATPTGN